MSVTAARGFMAAGAAVGIKAGGEKDLALVATDDHQPVPTAAVFTQNKMTAAPVVTSRKHLETTGGMATSVIINSGNANAATGQAGLDHAKRMCDEVARQLSIPPEQVLVCSTGLISIPLPIEVIEAGIPNLTQSLGATDLSASDAATAIMTTDTHPKTSVVESTGFVVGGMAKGAAMLAPNMATMLAVLTTDAEASPDELKAALVAALPVSFNALSVDGATSTNDTVILMASGRAGRVDSKALHEAVATVCADLAGQMAGDAEGATKVVRLWVTGAANNEEAAVAARQVAESQLVKCSWYGQDPYWGRIASELGSSGIEFDPNRLTVTYGGTLVAAGGVSIVHDEEKVRSHMSERHLEIVADLGLGQGSATILTNDLTHAYIDENMGTS